VSEDAVDRLRLRDDGHHREINSASRTRQLHLEDPSQEPRPARAALAGLPDLALALRPVFNSYPGVVIT